MEKPTPYFRTSEVLTYASVFLCLCADITYIFYSNYSRYIYFKMELLANEDLSLPPCKYEYLDHTADVQLHAWGDSLKEAFEQCGIAMFGYMTELTSVEIKKSAEIEAKGQDLESLLFHFLDELLFLFSCEPFLICSKVTITEFITEGEEMLIKCKCYGEEFTLGKHPQGTEVKAITYSAMQIVNEPDKKDFQVFVIIDI